MKLIAILLTTISIQIAGIAQSELFTSLKLASENEVSICAEVSVTNYSSTEAKILGQNVRLFYDSETLSFLKVNLSEVTSNNAYSLEMMKNVDGLTKDGKGQLSYEDNLGFINYNVNLDKDYLFDGIVNGGETVTVQTVCFEKLDKDASIQSIALAKKGVTDQYSQAFTQVESEPTIQDLLLPATITDLEYQEEIASLHK